MTNSTDKSEAPAPQQCPFCKSPETKACHHGGAWRVICAACNAEGPNALNEQSAIAQWDRAVTQDGLTVEEALKELREMFPQWKYFAFTLAVGAPRKPYWIKLGPSFYSADVISIWGETLDELMAQARAWKLKEGRRSAS